jgi:hypothetical protein
LGLLLSSTILKGGNNPMKLSLLQVQNGPL